ncbi:hypothetical protein QC823_08490 [Halomonas vilamensis]|uniref:PEP-CTERM protein-sorting domain-containing protein n=1 Tax=Vreelandella vilamensis TaxID=531309 RepID=A0ABU1H3Y8_9GAMM|nr:hypothetical protein [Halomonas vilamensis]MDR5899024.1 hypothetical protein [Halomonas vilamensis]
MPQPTFDPLRALAIGSQAVGLMVIITLDTVLRDAARPWQGVTLAVMLAFALGIAVMRRYRRNQARKRQAERAEEENK